MDHNSIAESAASPLEAERRFPGEDGGESLARMAERGLDAGLQLLRLSPSRAHAGNVEVVALAGEAGMGKSRLFF